MHSVIFPNFWDGFRMKVSRVRKNMSRILSGVYEPAPLFIARKFESILIGGGL